MGLGQGGIGVVATVVGSAAAAGEPLAGAVGEVSSGSWLVS